MYNSTRHAATIYAVQAFEAATLVYYTDAAAPANLQLVTAARCTLEDMLKPYYMGSPNDQETPPAAA